MRTDLVAVLAGGAGVALGATGTLAVVALVASLGIGEVREAAPAAPTPVAAPSPAPRPEPAPVCPDPDDLRKEIEALTATNALLRLQLPEALQPPSAWPLGAIPARYGADGLPATAQGWLAGRTDTRVDALDCSEYPCIAVLRYDGQAGGDAKGWMADLTAHVLRTVEQDWPEARPRTLSRSMRAAGYDGRYVAVGLLGPPQHPDRLTHRFEVLDVETRLALEANARAK